MQFSYLILQRISQTCY
uniref:Uncharacterized protein n=1 Tax=Anguilla anguilla TaxID=7936 RepID=A0A0E9VF07_ANGAN